MRLLTQFFFLGLCAITLSGCVEDTVYYTDGPQSQTYYTNTPAHNDVYYSSQTRSPSNYNANYNGNANYNSGYSSSQTRPAPSNGNYYSR